MTVDNAFAKLLSEADDNRGVPLRDWIYQLIRTAIVTGQLGPGEPVNEIEIARILGVSRTPVREAVKKVSDEGLIEIRAQSGTYVSAVRRDHVEEAYIVRAALEIESVSRAAATITAEQVRELQDIIERHDRALKRGQFAEALAHDDEFHRHIAEVNGLSMLWRAVDLSKARMDRCRRLAIYAPGNGKRTLADHKAILTALRNHDVEAARAAMRDHLEWSLRQALEVLDSSPERALNPPETRSLRRRKAELLAAETNA